MHPTPLWLPGQNNFAKLALTTPNGASAEIYQHGAHLTSWKPPSGREWLFLSTQAEFAQGKAIRGGVPIIFPQFSGFGPGPRHGFARNQAWQIAQPPRTEGNAMEAVFQLTDNPSTLTQWPHKFLAEFILKLTDHQLSMTLKITNTDISEFQFTAALHSYFALNDLHQAQLTGLQGLNYWDNNGSDFNNDRHSFGDDTLTFPGALDRVFFECQTPLTLHDGKDTLSIQAQGFREVVVWNPGEEEAKKLADLADHEFQHMLCIEAAIIDHPIHLKSGEAWSGTQILLDVSDNLAK
jgi:glucose-6-phosphate 1-epimerase